MDKNNSLVHVLQWKKGFFIGSFVFYLLFFVGILAYLHHVMRWYGVTRLVDDAGILLYGLYVPIFLVQLFECYLWGGARTEEYILSLPVKRRTVFFVGAVGNFLLFSLALLLCYGSLLIMLMGSGESLVIELQEQLLAAYIITLELYLLTQLLAVNCKNMLAALVLALVFNTLKYVDFGGHPRLDNFQQFFIYPYLTVAGGLNLRGIGTELSKFISVNLGIIAALLLLIVLSIPKRRVEAVGLFYHSWFRLAVVVLAGFYVVHFGWDFIVDLLGNSHLAFDFGIFTEALWLGGSVAVYWCIQKYLAKRGGI